MKTKTEMLTMPCLVINPVTGEGGVVKGVKDAIKMAQVLVIEGIQRGLPIVEAVVFVKEMEPAYAVAVELTPDGTEPKYVK